MMAAANIDVDGDGVNTDTFRDEAEGQDTRKQAACMECIVSLLAGNDEQACLLTAVDEHVQVPLRVWQPTLAAV